MSKQDNVIYNILPKTVRDIGHLIDLQQNKDEKSICDWIPKKDTVEDFKYKVYSLYETIDKNSSTRKKRKCLNAKQKRALFDLKKEKFDYKQFDVINKLWHSYLDSILDEIKTKADEIKLTRIDYHGAYLMVCSSKNITAVGAKGYVLQETKNTFRILNHENRLLEIPKSGTVFAFEHRDKLYKINGYNIMMSSFNRSKTKPKSNFIVGL